MFPSQERPNNYFVLINQKTDAATTLRFPSAVILKPSNDKCPLSKTSENSSFLSIFNLASIENPQPQPPYS